MSKIYCKGGGCSAKLGAGALDKVLSMLDKKEDENLLVGYEGHDDAAIYKINENQAIVSTLDFFPPLVEDPYIYGSIAAANAMSDVWAMGGKVLTALNIVCFPPNMDLNILGEIMEGGNAKVMEAGGILAGGHSIEDNDIKYGLSVTGIVDPDHAIKNNTPKEGDILYLTKPLGCGIVLCANRVQDCEPASLQEAVSSMQRLNKLASEAAVYTGASAMSDVTGFGLLVHLGEMIPKDSGLQAEIYINTIPYFYKTPKYIEEFYITAAGQRNRNSIASRVKFETPDYIAEELLYDPQTSGGLLIAIQPENCHDFEETMKKTSQPFWKIGDIRKKDGNHPDISDISILVKGELKHE